MPYRAAPPVQIRTLPGGERGIRTHGTLAGTPDFESGSFGLSDISPSAKLVDRTDGVKRASRTTPQGARGAKPPRFLSKQLRCETQDSGERGIRTLGTLAGTHDFQSCTFGHSVISPEGCMSIPWTRWRRATDRSQSAFRLPEERRAQLGREVHASARVHATRDDGERLRDRPAGESRLPARRTGDAIDALRVRLA